jgi:lysophospholipase L1-like esterase
VIRLLATIVFFVVVLSRSGATDPSTCNDLVAVGDSITGGYLASTSYPTLIEASVGSHAFNEGRSGAGWNDLGALAATEVDKKNSRGGRNDYCKDPFLILFAGTNDIFNGGKTGPQTYALFQNFISARLSAGWRPNKIVVVTMLPRSRARENERSAYNAGLVSGAAIYGYKLARVDLDPNIGCSGCETNRTFYVDGVHPNDTGQQVLANVICKAMNLSEIAACPSYKKSFVAP